MVTVAICGDIQAAMRLKMALEANGLSVVIPDESMAYNAPPQFFTSPSGVRVQVADEDAEAAKKIISEQAKS